MEIVSKSHVPKLLLLLFRHPSISLSFSDRTMESFCSHTQLSHTLPVKKFLFHLIKKDNFLGHLKPGTNKINKPQNSLQSLAGWKLPPQDTCFVRSSVAEFSGLSLTRWIACQEPKLGAAVEESLFHRIPKSLKSQSAAEGYHRGAVCCKD